MFFDLGQNVDIDKQAKFYDGYTIPSQINRNVAIDLGSNIGLFSIENHKNFGDIFAIEASYWNFITSLDNIRNNQISNVKCFNLAAGKKTGEIIKVYQNGHNSVINLLAALHVKGKFSVPSRLGHISLSNQSMEASTT